MTIGVKMMSDAKEFFKKTQQRLYAYKDIKAKLENDIRDLEDLKKEGASERSKDILYRSVSGGVRISREELQQIKIEKLCEYIKDGVREVSRINDALRTIDGDAYESIIRLKFFERKRDEDIAEVMCCDASTVRRNKARLIRQLAIRLYGIGAV